MTGIKSIIEMRIPEVLKGLEDFVRSSSKLVVDAPKEFAKLGMDKMELPTTMFYVQFNLRAVMKGRQYIGDPNALTTLLCDEFLVRTQALLAFGPHAAFPLQWALTSVSCA